MGAGMLGTLMLIYAGLMVTLVWLYLEILRLLGNLRQ